MSERYLLPFQQQLIKSVELGLDEIRAGGNSQGILLVGPSGSGKTHGLDALAARYPDTLDGVQRIQPCCRITVSAQADAVATVVAILTSLGKPFQRQSRMNLRALEPDMRAAIRARRVRILILEEFHNALLAGSPALRGQLARLLKNLWNMPPDTSPLGWANADNLPSTERLVIVLSGTDEMLPVFARDAELASRFPLLIRAQPLHFSPPESFREFRKVLRVLALRFGLEEVVRHDDNQVVARSLLACQSHLRLLEQLLRRAATLRRQGHPDDHVLELLAAAQASISGSADSDNVFRIPEDEVALRVQRAMHVRP